MFDPKQFIASGTSEESDTSLAAPSATTPKKSTAFNPKSFIEQSETGIPNRPAPTGVKPVPAETGFVDKALTGAEEQFTSSDTRRGLGEELKDFTTGESERGGLSGFVGYIPGVSDVTNLQQIQANKRLQYARKDPDFYKKNYPTWRLVAERFMGQDSNMMAAGDYTELQKLDEATVKEEMRRQERRAKKDSTLLASGVVDMGLRQIPNQIKYKMGFGVGYTSTIIDEYQRRATPQAKSIDENGEIVYGTAEDPFDAAKKAVVNSYIDYLTEGLDRFMDPVGKAMVKKLPRPVQSGIEYLTKAKPFGKVGDKVAAFRKATGLGSITSEVLEELWANVGKAGLGTYDEDAGLTPSRAQAIAALPHEQQYAATVAASFFDWAEQIPAMLIGFGLTLGPMHITSRISSARQKAKDAANPLSDEDKAILLDLAKVRWEKAEKEVGNKVVYEAKAMHQPTTRNAEYEFLMEDSNRNDPEVLRHVYPVELEKVRRMNDNLRGRYEARKKAIEMSKPWLEQGAPSYMVTTFADAVAAGDISKAQEITKNIMGYLDSIEAHNAKQAERKPYPNKLQPMTVGPNETVRPGKVTRAPTDATAKNVMRQMGLKLEDVPADMSPAEAVDREERAAASVGSGQGFGVVDEGSPQPVRGASGKTLKSQLTVPGNAGVSEGDREKSVKELAAQNALKEWQKATSETGNQMAIAEAASAGTEAYDPNSPRNLEMLADVVMRPSLQYPKGLPRKDAENVVAKMSRGLRIRLLHAADVGSKQSARPEPTNTRTPQGAAVELAQKPVTPANATDKGSAEGQTTLDDQRLVGRKYDSGMAVTAVAFNKAEGKDAPTNNPWLDVEEIEEVFKERKKGLPQVVVRQRRATESELEKRRSKLESDQSEYGPKDIHPKEAEALGYVLSGGKYVLKTSTTVAPVGAPAAKEAVDGRKKREAGPAPKQEMQPAQAPATGATPTTYWYDKGGNITISLDEDPYDNRGWSAYKGVPVKGKDTRSLRRHMAIGFYKTEQEAQAALDALAKKKGWEPVDEESFARDEIARGEEGPAIEAKRQADMDRRQKAWERRQDELAQAPVAMVVSPHKDVALKSRDALRSYIDSNHALDEVKTPDGITIGFDKDEHGIVTITSYGDDTITMRGHALRRLRDGAIEKAIDDIVGSTKKESSPATPAAKAIDSISGSTPTAPAATAPAPATKSLLETIQEMPAQTQAKVTFKDTDGKVMTVTGEVGDISGLFKILTYGKNMAESKSIELTNPDGTLNDKIQSVEVVKSAADVKSERDARQRGVIVYKIPRTRDEFESTLWDLAYQVVTSKTEPDQFGIRTSTDRSYQLDKQFNDVADMVGLSKTKRRYLLEQAEAKREGKPLENVYNLWDMMSINGSQSSGRAPSPSDFDPDPIVRRKRHPLNPLNLPPKAFVENSIQEAEFMLRTLKNKSTDKYKRRIRIVEERRKQLETGMYAEAVAAKQAAGTPVEGVEEETVVPENAVATNAGMQKAADLLRQYNDNQVSAEDLATNLGDTDGTSQAIDDAVNNYLESSKDEDAESELAGAVSVAVEAHDFNQEDTNGPVQERSADAVGTQRRGDEETRPVESQGDGRGQQGDVSAETNREAGPAAPAPQRTDAVTRGTEAIQSILSITDADQAADAISAAIEKANDLTPDQQRDAYIKYLEGDLPSKKPTAKALKWLETVFKGLPRLTGIVNVRPIHKAISAAKDVMSSLAGITSDDVGRGAMQGVWVDAKAGVAVATDGRRLIIVPYHGTQTGSFRSRSITEKNGTVLPFNKQGAKMDGPFPNWKQVIPKARGMKWTKIGMEELGDIARGAVAAKGHSGTPVMIAFQKDGTTIILDSQFVLESIVALSQNGVKEIEVGTTDDISPVVIRDASNHETMSIMMPIRNNDTLIRPVPLASTEKSRVRKSVSDIPDRVTQAELQEVVDVITEYQGGPLERVVLLDRQSDLPEPLRRASEGDTFGGLYDVDNDTIYLIRENITSQEEAAEDLLHELAHRGVKNINLMDAVDAAYGEKGRYAKLRDQVKKEYKITDDNDPLLVEEMIARIAQDGVKDPSVWDRFVAAVARALRTIGAFKNLTDAELRVLAARALDSSTTPNTNPVHDEAGIRAIETNSEKGFARARYSVRSFQAAKDRGYYDLWVEEMVRSGIDRGEATKFVRDLTGVAATVMRNKDLLDYDAHPEFDAVKENGDPQYKWSEDYTTICRKSQKIVSTISEIMARNKRGLTTDDILEIRSQLAAKKLPVNCMVCYVFSRWANMGSILDNMAIVFPNIPKDLIYDVRRSAELKRLYPDAWKWKRKRGSGAGKSIETRTDFREGSIEERFNPQQVEVQNRFSGMRLQSWSDFNVLHVIDMMQAVAERAKMGLAAHAYTKVADFVRMMAGTNTMTNMSLIPRGNGFNADGTLAFDVVEGMDPDLAFELREKYGMTSGTVAIGMSDRHIRALLADPRIDYVIPYHASGLKGERLAKVYQGWFNYSKQQNDRVVDKVKFDARIQRIRSETGMSKAQSKRIMPWEYWDPKLTPDQNARKFLKYAAESGVEPRFSQFRNHRGYWKLLIDRRMVDGDGQYIAQKPTVAKFDMGVINRIFKSYLAGDNRIDEKPDRSTVNKWTKSGIRGSVRSVTPEQDAEYLKAAKSGDRGTARSMVNAAAKSAGYSDGYAFHGTDAKGITVFKTPTFFFADKKHADTYALDRAAGEGKGRIYSAFLKLSRPASEEDVINAAKAVGVYENSLPAYQFITPSQMLRGEADKVIQHLQSQGFDGANIDEDFTMADPHNPVPSTVVFDPTQIKSADPVTRDNTGHIIPLSGRFDAKSPDIRFSINNVTPEQDSEYLELAKDPETNRNALQQMVDAAAAAAGALSAKASHFTKSAFTVFDNKVAHSNAFKELLKYLDGDRTGPRPVDRPGWTTDFGSDYVFPEDAHFFFLGEYPASTLRNTAGRTRMETYLLPRKTLDLTKTIPADEVAKIIEWAKTHNEPAKPGQAGFTVRGDLLGGFRNTKRDGATPQQLFNFIGGSFNYARQVVWRKMMDYVGYDSVMFESNSSGTSLLEPRRGPGDEKTYRTIAMLRPEAIKSADPVTRDESGAVIPLSQRFNQKSPDIRYSKTSTMKSDEEYLALAKNPDKNQNELQRMVDESAKRNGIPWSGVVNVKTGEIYQLISREDAAFQDFHHSLVVRPNLLDMMSDKEVEYFWITPAGDIESMHEWLSPDVKDKVKAQLGDKIRSHEPVVRDSRGRIAPLSQRFGNRSADSSNRDEEYLAAIRNDDMQAAQEIVDDAANDAGFWIGYLYHGTLNMVFNRFSRGKVGFGVHLGTETAASTRINHVREDHGITDVNIGVPEQDEITGKWHYWIEDAMSDGYETREDALVARSAEVGGRPYVPTQKGRVLKVHVKLDNPLRWPDVHFDDAEEFIIAKDIKATLKEQGYGKPDLSDRQMNEIRGMKNMKEVRKYLQSLGYDGIVYQNNIEDRGEDSYIVFDPNQIKSADPVTRNDAGEIIPPSKRFRKSTDIRYSLNRSLIAAQEYHSEDTCLSQVAAGLKKLVEAKRISAGTRVVDYGGGAYDKATQYLTEVGAEHLVFDPYNRSQDHNDTVESMLSGKPADVGIIANVLNVIKEKAVRIGVLHDLGQMIKAGGSVFVQVYDGDRTGEGKPTTKGWQENRPLKSYLPEVLQAFNKVKVTNGMIEASEPKPVPEGVLAPRPAPATTGQMELDMGQGPTPNIRGSRVVTPEQDAEYLKAIADGDMEAAQKMVDEVAKKTYSRARSFNDIKNDPRVESVWSEENDGTDWWIDLKSGWNNEEGGGSVHEWSKTEALAKFNMIRPQIVTRDSSGQVIPLSERFNEKSPDIRLSKTSPSDDLVQALADMDKTIDRIKAAAAKRAQARNPTGAPAEIKSIETAASLPVADGAPGKVQVGHRIGLREGSLQGKYDEILKSINRYEQITKKPYAGPASSASNLVTAGVKAGIAIEKEKGRLMSTEYSVDKAFKIRAKEEGVRELEWLLRTQRRIRNLDVLLAATPAADRDALIRSTMAKIFGGQFTAMLRSSKYDAQGILKATREELDSRLTSRFVRTIDKMYRRFAVPIGSVVPNKFTTMLVPAAKLRMEQWLVDVKPHIADLGKRDFDWLRTHWEESAAILALDKTTKRVVIGNRRILSRIASEELSDEVNAASKSLVDIETQHTPRNRGRIKELLVDMYSNVMNLTLTAFGKNSAGYDMIYNALEQGDRKSKKIERDAKVALSDLLESKGISGHRRWQMENSKHPITIGGRTFNVTDAERMYFAALWQREEAQNKLIKNGWMLRRMHGTTVDMRSTNPDEIDRQHEHMLWAQQILHTISPSEQAIVDKAVDIMTAMGAPANEVSRALYGYNKFNETRYFGMVVDTTAATDEDLDNGNWLNRALEGMGFTHFTIDHGQMLQIGNIFQQFDEHTKAMSKFIGLTLPIRNILNALNTNSNALRKALTEHFGTSYVTRLKEMMRDLAGLERIDTDKFRLLNYLGGNVSKAILSFNPGSYFSNRVGGLILYASELANYNKLAATEFATLGLRPASKILSSENKRISDLLQTDGYLWDRWNYDIARIYIPIATENIGHDPQSSGRVALRWIQQKALEPMKHAEISNAIQAFKALKRQGYTDAQAIDTIVAITRSTQNSSSALEDSAFMFKARRSAWGFFIPFMSQTVAARNMVMKYIIRKEWLKAGMAALALTLSMMAIGWFREMRRRLRQNFDNETYLQEARRLDKENLFKTVNSAQEIATQIMPGSQIFTDAIVGAMQGYGGGNQTLIDRPLERFSSGAVRVFRNLNKEGSVDTKDILNIVEATGQILGLPTAGPIEIGRIMAAQAEE